MGAIRSGAQLGQSQVGGASGELGQAAALFAQAGRLDEAARVMLLRGDGESDAAARLRHYVQALSTAPPGSAVLALARRKRASLLLSASEGAAISATGRQDLLEAARDLETAGEFEMAAQAYAGARDLEGEARTLTAAGDIEQLDALLHAQQARERDSLARRELQERMVEFSATGRRREAAALARSALDAALREQGRGIEARRVAGPVVSITLPGGPLRLVLGDRITLGRVATISVASAAVSREHLALERRGHLAIVRDLGSRNGTTLRGGSLALAGEMPIGAGLELALGGHIPLVLRPSQALPGAVELEVLGTRYVAPLGPAVLGVGAWTLQVGQEDDAWVELVTDDDPPAFLAGLAMQPRISLLVDDALSITRTGEPVVRVRAP